jgi:hypothetical protein
MTDVAGPDSGVAEGAPVYRTDAPPEDRLLFAGGPAQTLEAWLGLIRKGKPRIALLALLAVVVSWVPLVVLSALHGDLVRSDISNALLPDFGVHARFLLATPLLILAEVLCVPRLSAVARQFLEGGLVSDADRPRYDTAVASSERLMRSRGVEIAVILLAYALVLVSAKATPPDAVPGWHGQLNPFAPTPAGWWGLLISLPLLLSLLLGWLWRICVWTRFLWLMNRLPLQLDPSHPDHAGGLRFVGLSLEGFLPVAFVVGVIAAGPVANQVVHHHLDPLHFKSVAFGAAGIVVFVCVGPLLVFVRRLIDAHHQGILEYTSLAMHMGDRFRSRWMSPRQRLDQATIDMSDFTGTNASYSIAHNAFSIQILPVELRSVGLLIVTTFLPFVPVWLLAVPFGAVIKRLGDFML